MNSRWVDFAYHDDHDVELKCNKILVVFFYFSTRKESQLWSSISWFQICISICNHSFLISNSFQSPYILFLNHDIFLAKLGTHQYCVRAGPRLVAYLILRGKVLTVRTVRQPVFRHPLCIIMSALNAYFGYFSTFTKIHLNPLSLIVCPGRPCTCSAPSCHVVDSGIVRPMVDIPLVSIRG